MNLVVTYLKWWQTIKLSWANTLTYRMDFVLQVIAPSTIFLFIKYNLWTAIYNGDLKLEIAGLTFDQMIQYQMWSLIVLLLTIGHKAMNLSEDIRMGRISTYLIYPMNFSEHHTAGFLAFQSIQTLVSFFTIILFYSLDLLLLPSYQALFLGYAYCLLVGFLWYAIQYATGLLAFWLEETWMIRVMIQIITLFLSGGFIPLEFFPKAFQNILLYTPFPYLAYFPIKILTGQITDIGQPTLIVLSWLGVCILINKFLWKKGLRLYTAAGM